MQTTQTKGILCVFFCGVLWSSAGVLIKLLPWNALVIASLRSGIAALVLYLDLVFRQKKRLPVVNRHTLCAGCFLGATMFFFVLANKLTTAANAIVLQSTSTVFILLYDMLVRHNRPSRRDLCVTALVFGGIVLFFLDQLSPAGLLGNCLALCSAVMFAGVFLSSSDAKDEYTSSSGLVLGQFFCAVAGAPFLLIDPPEWTAVRAGAILFLGVFQLGAAYILFAIGSQKCSPVTMAIAAMVEPVLSPVWVALFAREIPGLPALCGGAIVIVSLTVWSIENARDSHRTEAHGKA